ncbi:MAG: HAD-IB family hydrolase [Synechococcales cyanobacterium CRU_2_2]|nr:HAD-IB family hydrolase [Synechococcales cyanobacterium CRU_2_2]
MRKPIMMEMQGQTLLITGIGGCVGQQVMRRAVQQGMRVRGLQRSPDRENFAETLGVEMLQGDITDPDVLAKVCEGVDIVVHAAAIVKESGELDEFRQVNVVGSVALAKAAQAAGVKAFVQVSSVVVYGMNYPEYVTEEGPFYDGQNPYCLTKLESEQQVMALNNPNSGFGVIVIRPGDVYGPRSIPWVVRPLEMMRDGSFFLINNGRGVINHVYVDNLVDGIFLAIAQQAYGEAFNITDGCHTSWKDYYQRLAKLENITKLRRVPAALAKLAIRLFPNRKFDATPDTIDIATRRFPYSIEKAQRVLGYQPQVDLDKGMAQTQDWLMSIKSNPAKPNPDDLSQLANPQLPKLDQPKLAVFDFDGTLTTKDSFMPFVASMLSPKTVRRGLFKHRRAVLTYLLGLRSNHFIKETLISQYFDGFDITQLETAGLRFATESLDQWLNPQALERLCWHQAQGHRVVIVSANLEVYLKPWAARYGIAEDDVIASKLALNAEAKITGKLEGNSCYGPEKVSRLEATLGPLDQYYLYAYGDSKGDRELLACADEPFYRSFAQGGSPWIR